MQADWQASERALQTANVAGRWQGPNTWFAAEEPIGDTVSLGECRAGADAACPGAFIVADAGGWVSPGSGAAAPSQT